MAQVIVYGLRDTLQPVHNLLSDVIHTCIVDAFNYPVDKKFQRYIYLEKEEFKYSLDRTDQYTIIEISIFEGRSVEAKKKLIRLLFERIQSELNISKNDVEITIFETPKHNWGIRGVPGDELHLNYKVNI